jgi:hypothetical protein
MSGLPAAVTTTAASAATTNAASARTAVALSDAGLCMRNSVRHGIRVRLQLAGRGDRDELGLAGRLIASTPSATAAGVEYSIVAPVHLDGAVGRPRLGAAGDDAGIPCDVLDQLKRAIDLAWRTSRSVDLVDERGRPLLMGSLHAHPAGLSRWLMHFFQDGR